MRDEWASFPGHDHGRQRALADQGLGQLRDDERRAQGTQRQYMPCPPSLGLEVQIHTASLEWLSRAFSQLPGAVMLACCTPAHSS
jgi:hypothetical protein